MCIRDRPNLPYFEKQKQNINTKSNHFYVCCYFTHKKELLQKLGKDNYVNIFIKFYNFNSKSEQDLYLQSLIEITEIQNKGVQRKMKTTRQNLEVLAIM